MPHETRRRRRRSSRTLQFTEPTSDVSQPWLVSMTDACLCITFVLVALGFGGRAAIGQLFLVAGALVTTGCWLTHQLTTREARYTWSGSEWLWCVGILVAGLQIVPLPQPWLLSLSPHLNEVLPLFLSSDSPLSASWDRLSMAPGETASALATFAAYGLLFTVVVQRLRTLADVERILCWAALASTAMAAFALIQYGASNEKFFWVIDHPYMTTNMSALGCFTNRNHLAQFLALGIGPLVWWILRRFYDQEQSGGNGIAAGAHQFAVLILLGALGLVVLTILLCFSRGGLLSLVIATCVSFGLLCRMGLASAKLALAMVVSGLAIGGIFLATGYDTLEKRVEGTFSKGTNEGRFEIWQANIDVARDFPVIGTGIGTHADAYQLHFDQANEDSMEYTHAESGYLQVASESGLCGLVAAAAFILASLRLCLRGLWHPDVRYSSAAAAVLASLLANISHAAFDFFWYTPSCMLLLAIQLAAALRLSQSREIADELPLPGFGLPRLVTATAACGLAAAGVWMLDQKIPAAQAEPDRMVYLRLSQDRSEQADDDFDLLEEKGDAVIRAARLDPSDSRLQESAGMEFLRRFDAMQETSENPLSFGQIRDVVKASEFKSPAEMKEWMQRAVGNNSKLLQLAARSFRRALQASPMRASACVKVAELSFLHLASNEEESALLNQALKLRPHDPQILFQVGRNLLLSGDMENAMAFWQGAFARSRNIQSIIVRQLAPQVAPSFFVENLKPDWQARGLIARAYQEIGREDDARPIFEEHITEGLQLLKTNMPPEELEMAVISLHEACTALRDRDMAIKVLSRGLKRAPQSYLIRYRLAWELYGADRFADAAEHLKWCASRHPDDKALQEAAAHATKQGLKTAQQDSRGSG